MVPLRSGHQSSASLTGLRLWGSEFVRSLTSAGRLIDVSL